MCFVCFSREKVVAAAGPRWAIQQLLRVVPRIDTGPLSGKRAVWTARGMLQRPSVRYPQGSRGFRPQGLFMSSGVAEKPRLRSRGRCKSKSQQLCRWVWGQKETKYAGWMGTFHRLLLVSCLPRGGSTGRIGSSRHCSPSTLWGDILMCR